MATLKRTPKSKKATATSAAFLSAKAKNKFANRKTFYAAKQKLADAAFEARERFNDVEESVHKFAKAHPWKTMGMTLLAGVVVGRLFRR